MLLLSLVGLLWDHLRMTDTNCGHFTAWHQVGIKNSLNHLVLNNWIINNHKTFINQTLEPNPILGGNLWKVKTHLRLPTAHPKWQLLDELWCYQKLHFLVGILEILNTMNFFLDPSAFGRALATPTLINTKKVKLLNSYLKENLTKHYDSIYKTVINIKVILTLKRRKRKKSKSCETFQWVQLPPRRQLWIGLYMNRVGLIRKGCHGASASVHLQPGGWPTYS